MQLSLFSSPVEKREQDYRKINRKMVIALDYIGDW
jgi:hypothetical protein